MNPDNEEREADLGPPSDAEVAWGLVAPVIGALIAAVCIFIALAHFDDTDQRTAWIDASGQARGSIVDRFGHTLAWTTPVTRGAVRSYAPLGLTGTVGFRDALGHWSGLERTLSSMLDPKRTAWSASGLFNRLSGRPARGDTVHLTIDAHVQATAVAALGKATGAVVALDPRTGEVLAMVSNPSCPAESMIRHDAYKGCEGRLTNRAIRSRFAPGSTFKIVTLDAALDIGKFHLSDVFTGADIFGPSPYFDNSLYPSNITRDDLTSLTLSQALAFSDNFTFAHIGLQLGAPTLLSYGRRFYIGRKVPFDLPVAISTMANGRENPSKSVLAQTSFGAGVDSVTPLQMAMIAAAVANRGVLMDPQLVRSIVSPTGSVVKSIAPHALGRVVKPATARDVTTAMSFVVNHGSGYKAQIPGIQVAGKTGTAVSGGPKPNAWFICFAPARHPVVAVAVLHEASGEGFQYAAPIARKVLSAALRDSKHKPS